jgi:membrane dipeptidase
VITDRRSFIAATVVAALAPRLSVALGDDPLRGMTVVNALGGLDNPNVRDPDGKPARPTIDPRTLADARRSGLTAVNVTMGYVFGAEDPFESSVRSVAQWDALVRSHAQDLLKVLTTADIARARDERRVGVIFGFQNAAMLGDKADRADIFADLGVRVIQLTYNGPNQLGDGSMAPGNRGLTPFGREVVERLNANRVMIDLSHSGQQICIDAAQASRQPVSINHTGCRALTDLPRNKSDEELRLVASQGGFIGIYFMPFLNATGHARALDVVAHIEHAVDVCGEDHVGIGTDGGTTPIDDLEAYRTALAREVADRRAAGISAQGERQDTYPFVVDLRGPEQFRELARLLEARGHTTGRIEKILGANFVRYARDVWGA